MDKLKTIGPFDMITSSRVFNLGSGIQDPDIKPGTKRFQKNCETLLKPNGVQLHQGVNMLEAFPQELVDEMFPEGIEDKDYERNLLIPKKKTN